MMQNITSTNTATPNNTGELDQPISLDTTRKIKYHFFKLHDTIHSQNYGKTLPYSFHLNSVVQQLFRFRKIMFKAWVFSFGEFIDDENSPNKFITNKSLFSLMMIAGYAHDSIEDLSLTYNDLIYTLAQNGLNSKQSIFVADIVFAVTDEKGKTREARKNDKFYSELFQNEQAVIIKLSDMFANLLHTITFNHGSVENKKNEFAIFVDKMPDELRIKYIAIIDMFISAFNIE